MERQSQTGQRLDDQLKQESESLTTGGLESRADEGRLKEDLTDRPLDSGDDVTARSNIARFLEPSIFPASKEEILRTASENHAFSWIIQRLEQLPDGERFDTVEAVWQSIGGEPEERF